MPVVVPICRVFRIQGLGFRIGSIPLAPEFLLTTSNSKIVWGVGVASCQNSTLNHQP